jgi:hypothetical protein
LEVLFTFTYIGGENMAAKINLRTGKIIGAEKGTFAWYHEKGHLVYDDSERGITNGVYQNGALYASLLFLLLGDLSIVYKILAGLSIGTLIGLALYEEIWCNIYASDMMDKKEESKLKNMKGGQKQK